MRWIIVGWITFLLPQILVAQFQVSGTVKDQEGHPLEFASVYLDETGFAAATDRQGRFGLSGVPEDEYLLVVSFLGFKEFQEVVYIEQDTTFQIALQGEAFGLDQVEIRGTWAREKYPFATTEFKEESLQARLSTADAPYLLQYAPSVVVSSDAGTGVGYTGIRIRGVDPTRVNVTVNGIPLNDAESQSVYWVDLPDIMNSVKDVQIQRGVGTSTNGAGAFGATLNLNTNKLNINPYATIEGALGSYNTQKMAVELGTGILNDRFTLDGRYSLIRSDGYVDRAKSSMTSFYLSGARVAPKQSLRFNIFSGHEITYQSWYGLPVQYLDTNRTFNAAGIDNDFSKTDPYENEIDNYRQNHYQLFWNRELRKDWKAELAFHYTRGKGYFEQFKNDQDLEDYGLSAVEKRSDLVRRKWLDNHFFGLIYNLEKRFGKSGLILGGGVHDYLGNHYGQVDTVYDQTTVIPLNYLYYDNDAAKLDANLYGKYTYEFLDFSLLLDLQYRLVHYRFQGIDAQREPLEQELMHHFFNPKAGIFWQAPGGISAYASVAMANKEPNRDDYIASSPDSRPGPERLTDLEAGFRHSSASMAYGLNVYYMKYKDQLVLTGKLNDVGDYTRINIPDSYRAGVELEGNAKWGDFLDLFATATWSKNKITTFTEYIDDWDSGNQVTVVHENTDISFAPALTGSAGLIWHILSPSGRSTGHNLDLALNQKFVGRQFLDNTMNEGASLDPFQYTDLNISYAFKSQWIRNASLTFIVNNLFNVDYVSNGWVYRYKSDGYDPVPFDPYSVADRDLGYQMIGLFPQATRHYTLKLLLDF